MLNKVILYINTLKFLKLSQIYFLIIYRIKKLVSINLSKVISSAEININLNWENNIYNQDSYVNPYTFNFTNVEHDFNNCIDWNFNKLGKLWLYNLNYFDFLNQKNLKKEEGEFLIHDFISKYNNIYDGKDSYPTSLRIINITKFIARFSIVDNKIINLVATDSKRLLNNLELHLLANHYLENGFALFFAANLLDDKHLYRSSKKILISELENQIIKDGAHYELSPTYHQILLFRLLDTMMLIKLNINKNEMQFFNFLRVFASRMTSWLNNISYSDKTFPLFNDAAFRIAPKLSDILNYGKKFKLDSSIPLSDSGFRMIKEKNFELFINVSEILSNYQPGHFHADTFNFELKVRNNSIFVDTGTSTYEKSSLRSYQRSTYAHNTVNINNISSSEVWDSFRVARRAKIISLDEKNNIIEASHDGYKRIGIIHQRKWEWSENQIIIKDRIIKNKRALKSNLSITANFYLSNKILLNKNALNNIIFLGNNVSISFENNDNVEIIDCHYATEFNKLIKSKLLSVSFNDNLITKIKIN